MEMIFGVADVKEKQALAYTGFLADKEVPYSVLQQMVDDYCDKMATGFIHDYCSALSEKDLQRLKNRILELKANKPHSGYRFYEALYKQIVEMNSTSSNERS